MRTKSKILAALAAIVMTTGSFAADIAGNWKWTTQGQNGAQESTAKFELKEGKLTGNVKSPRGETDISSASIKDGAVAFNIEREFNGNKMTIKYTGKLDGDTIKGSIERPGRNGGEAPRRIGPRRA